MREIRGEKGENVIPAKFLPSRSPIAKVATRPFRILMIAPTSFFSDYGGHIRILEETRVLQAEGHQVTIVTYYKGSDLPGLDIRRTARLPWHTDYEVGSSRHKLAFDVYLSVQSLIEGLRVRPDVIHGHMHEGALIGGILAWLLQVPLVFDFQGSLTAEMVDHSFLNPNGRLYTWTRRLERLITGRLPQAILTSSLRASRLLQDEFAVPADKIYPLPDCADPVRFDPAKIPMEAKEHLREQLGIPADRCIVAYLGLLTDYQGIPDLIEAAVRLKKAGHPIHFLVMGYPNVESYKIIAQQRGAADVMTFTGRVEYRHAPLYLSLGDIAVAPKLSTTEGSGKLLNYMAMAQPVVAYDTAVHHEYLANLGVYAPVGDVAAFTEAIAALSQDPERRAYLGQELRQRASEVYSWQRACTQIVKVYEDLTK
jgi:glycosyltransferase involved in cell wall biosynthesis